MVGDIDTRRSRRRRSAGRMLLVALLVAAGAAVVFHRSRAGPADSSVWSDEFDGPANTAPDSTRWAHNTGGTGWGNNELEYYTDSTTNAALDGAGHLVITARRENPAGYACHYGRCEYTSARLLTAGRFSRAYGRFEARIKLPRGQGLWPAFWMLSDDPRTGGEIDVMENVGSEPGTVHGSLHGPGYSGDNGLTSPFTLPAAAALADDFHVFAVDWSPAAITWFVDGTAYSRKTPADAGGKEWVFNYPFFMVLNVAVGGTWPGPPAIDTPLPQAMIVDYVRVHSNF
ncbi:glycoside hydrolase family 16 protein [Actinoplanes sp. NPDC026619]|uniref:glycoside hydrolase family 16 protein n=1 Tax=Actinoplanes sp. NPDC026619 TaxID=3155798 RepID=UPI003407A2D5